MADRQQFNVTLPPALVRRVKYRAIDAQLSASHLVESLLETQLARDGGEMSEQLSLQPMVHVEDMSASVNFYEALGAKVVQGSRDGDYVLLDVAGSSLALLAHPPNPDQDQGPVELQFAAHADLSSLEQRLRSAQVRVEQPVTDEAFGAQLQVRSPDGLLIKINQLEPDLYT